jgi:hypothetical protein
MDRQPTITTDLPTGIAFRHGLQAAQFDDATAARLASHLYGDTAHLHGAFMSGYRTAKEQA